MEPLATPFPETSAETDREALIALYNATGGPNWLNNSGWLTEAPIGEWHGVVVNQDGRVRELQLARNQLRGEIPQEIGNLSELIILFLALNELEGPIPSEIGGLQNLELLGLQQNNLSGEIPITLASLEKLTSLNLGANPIVGERPLWLESLVFLQSLSLPKDMTGCVSDFLAEAIRLVWVEEHSIPLCDVTDHPGERTVLAALYHATNGENWEWDDLWLSDEPLGNWVGVTTDRNGRVVRLILYDNNLQGQIPEELSQLSQLHYLILNDNQLTGEVPLDLGALSNLVWLNVAGNSLTGCLPASLDTPRTRDRMGDLEFCP